LSASIASGRLAEDLNELTEAELEFIAYDWELWARDDQLAPLLIAPGDSPSGSRPPGGVVDLIDDYAEVRRSRYRALPHFWRFGRGWLKRVDATLVLGRAWAGAEATNRGLLEPAQIAKGELEMDNGTTGATATDDSSKWWAHSKTMWGTIITAAATVIPVLGPALGITLPADVITTFGDQALTAVQALTGLFGTVLAIYGRLNAASPLTLRKG
jgi:hypothetical protein